MKSGWCRPIAPLIFCLITLPAPRRAACTSLLLVRAEPRTCPAWPHRKPCLPVLGVPVQSQALNGLDSLLSIVQMPGGIPVGALAIGKAGAINAALLAAAMLGNQYPAIREAVREFRNRQTATVLSQPDPRNSQP